MDSVFKGYISRDRRKPHIVEADRAAEQLLRRARAAGEAHGCVCNGCLARMVAHFPQAMASDG